MVRLGALSDEMTHVFTDLGAVAPDINRFLLELGPFSQAGIPALDSLGEASKIGTPAVQASLPVIKDLRTFAKAARPVGKTLAEVLVSFQRNDGIERLMDYIFFQATAVNGFDSFGHYLRAGLIVNQCTTYAVEPTTGCSANFRRASASASAAGADAMPRDPVLAWMAQVLAGADPTKDPPRKAGRRRKPSLRTSAPRQTRPKRDRGGEPAPSAPAPTPTPSAPPAQPEPAATPAPSAPAPTATPTPSGGEDPIDPLLDYLFGGDG
jgi:phospholipid/cholesterol/gamma-HCH transport system substrate-binding protein